MVPLMVWPSSWQIEKVVLCPTVTGTTNRVFGHQGSWLFDLGGPTEMGPSALSHREPATFVVGKTEGEHSGVFVHVGRLHTP